jgi:hypothetical protein
MRHSSTAFINSHLSCGQRFDCKNLECYVSTRGPVIAAYWSEAGSSLPAFFTSRLNRSIPELECCPRPSIRNAGRCVRGIRLVLTLTGRLYSPHVVRSVGLGRPGLGFECPYRGESHDSASDHLHYSKPLFTCPHRPSPQTDRIRIAQIAADEHRSCFRS